LNEVFVVLPQLQLTLFESITLLLFKLELSLEEVSSLLPLCPERADLHFHCANDEFILTAFFNQLSFGQVVQVLFQFGFKEGVLIADG